MSKSEIEELLIKVGDGNPGALTMACATEYFTNQAGALRYLLARGLKGAKLWEEFNGSAGEMRNFIYKNVPRGGSNNPYDINATRY